MVASTCGALPTSIGFRPISTGKQRCRRGAPHTARAAPPCRAPGVPAKNAAIQPPWAGADRRLASAGPRWTRRSGLQRGSGRTAAPVAPLTSTTRPCALTMAMPSGAASTTWRKRSSLRRKASSPALRALMSMAEGIRWVMRTFGVAHRREHEVQRHAGVAGHAGHDVEAQHRALARPVATASRIALLHQRVMVPPGGVPELAVQHLGFVHARRLPAGPGWPRSGCRPVVSTPTNTNRLSSTRRSRIIAGCGWLARRAVRR